MTKQYVPSSLDFLLSRIRRYPGPTLEARAERQFHASAQTVPRNEAYLNYEYDPILARRGPQATNRAKYNPLLRPLRPWFDHQVTLRNMRMMRFGNNAIIRSGTIMNARSSVRPIGISTGDDFYVKENSYIDSYGGWIEIGRGAAIAQATTIHGNGGVTIGDYLMMGHGSMILAGNHNHALDNIPFMYQGSTARGIVLGCNVWLGAGAIILDGVTIGDNVVVGAGTTVSQSIPSNCLVHGNRELIISNIDASTRGKPAL